MDVVSKTFQPSSPFHRCQQQLLLLGGLEIELEDQPLAELGRLQIAPPPYIVVGVLLAGGWKPADQGAG
jgi:hypothetical protein